MRGLRYLLGAVPFSLAVVRAPAPAAESSTAGGRDRGFWQLTDVHVDLLKECSGTAPNWYGSFAGQYGCGCTVETVNATADFMRATAPSPDFILFTGDASASGAVADNLAIIQGSVERRFPEVPVYLVLGNHDFPDGGGSPVGPAAASWYRQVAESWRGVGGAPHWPDAQAQAEFGTVGYYSTTPPGADLRGVRLVVLNTELFNHGNDHVVAGETIEEALAHLKWLNETLASVQAARQRAYILGHVPIGMETAYGNDRSVPSVLRPYWMDLFAKRYQDIVDSFGEAVIAVQLFGHEHVDTFRLLGEKTVAVTTPSLSTAYPRTNPTVRFWHHELSSTTASAAVVDYTQYIMDLLLSNQQHRPIFNRTYSFRSEYGMPDLSRSSYEALLDRFQMETHMGQLGWSCGDTNAATYVVGRSLSHKDPGFNATKADCSRQCATTTSCQFWQWGHTLPDFQQPNAWCYLYTDCNVLQKDSTSAEYQPKYGVWPVAEGQQALSSVGTKLPPHTNGSSYARERRFFLSSTPTTVQPPCDRWCRMQDLCDKKLSGATTSDACFTECIENDGRALVPPEQ